MKQLSPSRASEVVVWTISCFVVMTVLFGLGFYTGWGFTFGLWIGILTQIGQRFKTEDAIHIADKSERKVKELGDRLIQLRIQHHIEVHGAITTDMILGIRNSFGQKL